VSYQVYCPSTGTAEADFADDAVVYLENLQCSIASTNTEHEANNSTHANKII